MMLPLNRQSKAIHSGIESPSRNAKSPKLLNNFGRGLYGVVAIAVILLLSMVLVLVSRFATKDPSPREYTFSGRRATSSLGTDLGDVGSFVKWSKVEIALSGPESEGMSKNSNPFQIAVDVTFVGPEGQSFVVPAFYDGNGSGGLDGTVWKVRFSPDAVGAWNFSSASSHPQLDGYNGTFTVTAPTDCPPYVPGGLPDLGCVGRLAYVGEHYLKFTEGPYWLKGGEDDPEDFLAPGQTVGFGSKMEAIDYLASQGVNSLYIMLHNVGGDEHNVWPWVGATANEARANHEHFDVAKLAEWEEIFSYIQAKGIVLHLVLEDDSGWTGFNRVMYYREIIARFGHHPGLYWNISEEYNENYSDSQVKSFAQGIRDLDPYDHPITVHHQGGLERWAPFVGDPRFDLTSFQTGANAQNEAAAAWFQGVADSERTIPTSFDETGKIAADNRNRARHIVWSVYMGGGNFELHTSPLSDYRDFAAHFEDMARARTFVEALPFWQMQPMNSLLTSGEGYIFAQPGEVYVVYLPSGGTIQLDLTATSNIFDHLWFNPRQDSIQNVGTIDGGSIRSFTAPDDDDWVLMLKKHSGTSNTVPLAQNKNLETMEGTEVAVTLSYADPDGPGPYTFTVVQQPSHGTVSGSGASRTYVPDPGYTGADSFAWKVNDGIVDSNIATVSISVKSADGANQPPVAEDQSVHTMQDTPVEVQLGYTDPDNGPGPYTVTITQPPANGTLGGNNNDRNYMPHADFTGTDSFTWRVNDGLDDSNQATVEINVVSSEGDPAPPPARPVYLPSLLR